MTFTNLQPFFNMQALFEFRDNFQILGDYDANNNLIYVGWSSKIDAATSENVFMLRKNTYDANNNMIKSVPPDDGQKEAYNWDNRTTFFT